jgi:phage terminase large subunit-like protein
MATVRDYSQVAKEYATDVVSGKVIACSWIVLACKRFLTDIKSQGRWTYDPVRAEAICSFGEKQRHEKGQLQGQRIHLEPAQVWLLCNIFGLVDRRTGVRKYREALIMLPRGQGKSPLAAIIALWMAFFDGEPGAEVYCGANKESQAHEVFRPAKAMVEQEPTLTERFGIVAAAKSIYRLSDRSRFQPVVRKPGDGASVYCAILDELHEALDSTLYDTFKTGANKRPGSLMLVISTAGVQSTENPCHQLQLEAQKVLDGTADNERLFAAIFTIDQGVDWTKPEAVEMANPLLGISNDREAVLLDQQAAVRSPAKANVFKAKHLNIWSTAAAAWMNMTAWDACADPELTADKLKDLRCWIGSDLASKLDLAACIRLYRDDSQGDKPHYYALTRVYTPEEQVNQPENQHYQRWAAEGHLSATSGASIDYSEIEADILCDIAESNVQNLPYDERYADQWSQRVSEASGLDRVIVPPSPAVLSPAMKELEAAIYDGRFHHDGHPVLRWCMSNVLTRETAAGNYTMPDKARPEAKIDAAVALFIAMTQARLAPVAPTAWAFTPFTI